MSKDIKTILKEATKDLLTEQTLADIKSAYDTSVNSLVEERTKLAVSTALDKQDADYSAKVEKLLGVIDSDHTNKLNRVVEALDKNHVVKLKKVINHYEKALTEDANKFKSNLVNKLDKYLELYLEEKIPNAQVAEAVENVQSARIVSQMRTLLGVDLAMATESIREAVLDGKAQIEDYKKALAEANKKLSTVTESHKTASTALLIESKTAELPSEKKKYMKKVLAGKSEQYITENYDYVLNLFDKNEAEQLDVLREQATETSHSMNVDRPTVVEESVNAEEQQAANPVFNTYMSELKKF